MTSPRMIPGFRTFLTLLVYGFAVFLVSFAVLISGGVLAHKLGEPGAGEVLMWIAAGVSLLLVVNILLLVAVLGIGQLSDRTSVGRAADAESSSGSGEWSEP